MATPHPNQLIVEGKDDRHAILHLMSAHVDWPLEATGPRPAEIKEAGGIDVILNDAFLTTTIKQPGLHALGVVLDADTAPQSRYQRIRQLCLGLFSQLPVDLPIDGVVVEEDGKRFGVWIMPDNVSPGKLEVFLQRLIPDDSQPVWQHATDSVSKARRLGATCRDCDIEKSHLYTWLAWQNPPGQTPGTALTARVLDPHAALAQPFVTWFKRLYNL